MQHVINQPSRFKDSFYRVCCVFGGLLLTTVGVSLLASQSARAACSTPPSNYGSVTQTLSVPSASTYRIWSRIMAANSGGNKYWLEVDGGNCYVVGGNSSIAPNVWTWVNYQNGNPAIPIDVSLAAGSHSFKLVGNVPGVKIDRILALADAACTPTGTGDNCAIANNTPPTVTLAATPTSALQSQTVSLTATAIDNASSSITKVDFYDGTTLLGTDTTSPYSYNWVTSTSITVGTHNITAKATDALNLIGTSTVATVTISADTSAPTSPTGLSTAAVSSSQINLTWAASSDNIGVAGYQVFRNGGTIPISTVTSTSFGDTNLAPGTNYTYTVKAFDIAGNVSAASNTANATTVSAPDTTPPTVNLTTPTSGAIVSGSAVALSATATDNVAVANVTFSIDGTSVGSPDTTSPYSVNWNSTTVTNGSHTVMATAKDAAGNVSNSQYSVTVNNGDTTAPSAPAALAATAISGTQVNLSWTASTDNVGVAGYYIVRNGVMIKQTVGTVATYSDTTAAPSTSYSYYVYAYDSTGNLSANSNTATVTTPAAPDTIAPSVPAGLTATAVSSSQINLAWSASTDNVGVTGYQVFRNGSLITTVATTSYGDTGLAASTAYSYTVKAVDAAGNISAASVVANATTQAAVVQSGTLTGTIIAPPAPVRVDSGNTKAFTDNTGLVYQADAYFTGGTTDNLGSGHDITGTVNDVMFQTERYGAYSYKVPIPNGSYTFRLHFAELSSCCFAKGSRVFNVIVNGNTYLSKFDIYALVGKYAINNQQTSTNVTNGQFTIQLTAVKNNPTLNSFEIIPAASVQPPAAGATVSYADSAGQHSVTSNSAGVYGTATIPVGSYVFTYSFPNYVSQTATNAIISNTATTKNVTLIHL